MNPGNSIRDYIKSFSPERVKFYTEFKERRKLYLEKKREQSEVEKHLSWSERSTTNS